MDRAEVLEQMAPILSTTARAVDHGPGTRVLVADGGALALRTGSGARSRVLTDEGTAGLYRFLGLGGLPAQLEPATRAKVATELLAARGRYTLLLKDDQVTDVAKAGEYRPLNPERVIDQVGRTIPEADFSRVLLLPHHTVQLEIVGAETGIVGVPGTHERVNDLVRAGVMLGFSPIGSIQPMIQSYVSRLVCTNGMVTTDVLRNFAFGGEGDNVWQFFRQGISEAYGAMGRIVERWSQLAAEEVAPGDRAMILTALLKEAGFAKETVEAVRARALEEPPATMYDMLQLVTWGSSHVERDPVRVVRAQRAAGRFHAAETHDRMCPTCRRTR